MIQWPSVYERGREVAHILTERGRPTVRYANSHGRSVNGWCIDYHIGTTRDPTEYHTGADYKDAYANHRLILGEDGGVYLFTLLTTERGKREPGGFRVTVAKRASVMPVRPETLNPSTYERMRSDDIFEALNRLASKQNFNPEPSAPSTEGSNTFSADPVTSGASTHPTTHIATPWHEATETHEEEGSEWAPLLLLALGVLIFVAMVAIVVLLTADVQYH
jgi:hypothetical protein